MSRLTSLVKFGEPLLHSAPIYMSSMKSLIECDSYVSYTNISGRTSYGRFISTTGPNNGGDAYINQYMEPGELCDKFRCTQQPIYKPYIDVKELVQTTKIVKTPPSRE